MKNPDRGRGFCAISKFATADLRASNVAAQQSGIKMGKLQNQLCVAAMLIVVISAIACQAYQHSNSDYSENLNQQHPTKQQLHRHHNHHHHKLDSVSLGHRNSSRYSSLIASTSNGNNYYQPPSTNNYHHQQHTGNPVHGQHHLRNQHQQPRTPTFAHNNRRVDNPAGSSWRSTAGPTRTPRTNQIANTGGVRAVKRMLKSNHHPRNITG